MRETTFVAKPFVNEFNQTINPGDPVLYAGTGWHQTTIRRGTYEGVHEHPKYGVVSVRVGDVPDRRYSYVKVKTPFGEEYVSQVKDVKRKAILPLKRVYLLNTGLDSFTNKSFG